MHLAKRCYPRRSGSKASLPTPTSRRSTAEVYDTERHLLHVACTRAQDHLLVTGVDPASEFLADLAGDGSARHHHG